MPVSEIPNDFSARIRELRVRHGLSQTRLAELLGVSFASINRWENGKSQPNRVAWRTIKLAEKDGIQVLENPNRSQSGFAVAERPTPYSGRLAEAANIDFSARPEIVRSVVEAERLSFGHLFNPAFATETSMIEPLPHQRIAVYQHMLNQPRLRFLLADDPGAGKTIMAGLYIREMLTRRLIRRVLIVPPAGLVGNWEREMRTLFSLQFRILSGADARAANPFMAEDGDLVIVSVDTLRQEKMFVRLADSRVQPYDLVIFDEAHKLSADREPDFRVRKTDRYQLAEAVAGIPSEPKWKLSWQARHLMLLTATPHMGKPFPYYCLWRLLEPQIFSTMDAFNQFPAEARERYFIRRSKEEMVHLDGTAIYPKRRSETPTYDLSAPEQALYDETTSYIETYYNRARILNRSAARLAMSIFQRRLASSTYSLSRSFERRLAKLEALIQAIKSGEMTLDHLHQQQAKLDSDQQDIFDDKTGDEEQPSDGDEENEVVADKSLGGIIATSLSELETERKKVAELFQISKDVLERGDESKFDRLLEVLRDENFRDEKFLIFTEHKDTLIYLVRRLEGLGFTGKVAQIHGGMHYTDREKQVEFFRRTEADGGASIMIATDAAGEGINLQFCWLMVNYDIPWNPARIEQRFGRIHRYGQKHDPVLLYNLVAGKTREGRVLHRLLEKLESIRKELGSDKVFDIIGRMFEGVSLKELILSAVMEGKEDEAIRQIEGRLTPEQVHAIEAQREKILKSGGDVSRLLPDERRKMEREDVLRLLPGYIRRFIEESASPLGIGIVGDLDDEFAFRSLKSGSLDPIWPLLENYDPDQRNRLTVYKPKNRHEAVFLHPGEPVFDRYRSMVSERFGADARRGGVFIDPFADRPYFFHLALVSVMREDDPEMPDDYGREEPIGYRLVGLRHEHGGEIEQCPVESLLFLRGCQGVPTEFRHFATDVKNSRQLAYAFALNRVAEPMAEEKRQSLTGTLPERLDFLKRGYDFEEAELAGKRTKLTPKAREGDARAKGELTKIKDRQRVLEIHREQSNAVLRREPDLIVAGETILLAHALVVPSRDPEDRKRHDREVEMIAVRIAWSHEESRGSEVKDVSLPHLARQCGLGDSPGFDLFSRHPQGEIRNIEVKGRAGIGDIELTENEWAKACNLRSRYWLYVVFECASAHPRLLRIQDPFGKLMAKTKGGVIIEEQEIFEAAERES